MRQLLALAAVAAGAVAVAKQFNRSRGATKTSTVEESIEIDVPVRTAYNQWTQFEDFPRFMHGVIEVRQLDDKRLRWHAEIGGREEEWDSEITEQVPDQRIAWRSIDGPRNAGVVTFHRLSDDRCRVMLQMNYEPRGMVETVGDMFGAPAMRVCGNLQRFKDFLERRGSETGAWRGSISAGADSRGRYDGSETGSSSYGGTTGERSSGTGTGSGTGSGTGTGTGSGSGGSSTASGSGNEPGIGRGSGGTV